MQSDDEAGFLRDLLSAVQEAEKLGYRPAEFKKMLANRGALATVRTIVGKGSYSEGFMRLYELERIDLTCEAKIVETEWRRLFDGDLLQIAERRLRQFGYQFRPYDGSKSVASLPAPVQLPDSVDDFIPSNDDTRERQLRVQPTRPDQRRFRAALISAYGARCCITGTTVADVLEAAHIAAYRGEHSNHVRNGLLLRADVHALFDRYLLSIEPTSLQVVLSRELKDDPTYGPIDGAELQFGGVYRPSAKAIKLHWKVFGSPSETSN